MNLPFVSARTISIGGLIAGIPIIISFLQVPAAAQNSGSGCTVALIEGILPAAIVPGRLVVGNSYTTLSSEFSSDDSGKIGLICTGSFSATINDNDIQQVQSTGATEFASVNAEVTDISSTTIGLLSNNVLSIDLTATEPNTSIIGAGGYSFTVPVTVTGSN